MSSFFTLPASQKKRKRNGVAASSRTSAGPRKERKGDDSISGSDTSDDARPAEDALSEDDDEDFEDEDPAAKRIRLAEQYLANTQREVLEDGGFDAADVDQENLRRRMGDRLKEDTAEGKGKIYRWIADQYDWRGAHVQLSTRLGLAKAVTGIAIHDDFVYIVSKDSQLVKMKLSSAGQTSEGGRPRNQPKVVVRARGNRKATTTETHQSAILCIAVSPDGKFVATGGADKKLIIWDGTSLKPLKVFTQHRDAVTALAFRRRTNQVYSASKDRTIKTWSLNELAYVESLFGHQDEIVGIDALAQEKCVTVGARDRTARLWKIVEEAQLVFRGGGAGGTAKAIEALKRAYGESNGEHGKGYAEGSIDCVAMLDDDTFVTGSDNGSLSLWNVHKKKAVYTLPLAHGLDPALPLDHASAEEVPDEASNEDSRGGKQARWITALKAVPFSDVLVSGSWDGYIRVWRVTKDKRRLESLGAVGVQAEDLNALLDGEGVASAALSNDALQAIKAGLDSQQLISGVVNDLAIVDQGERGKDGMLIAAAVGKEHRLGRWKDVEDAKNCIVLCKVSLRTPDHPEDAMSVDASQNGEAFEGFE